VLNSLVRYCVEKPVNLSLVNNISCGEIVKAIILIIIWSMALTKQERRIRLKKRIRKNIVGGTDRLRMSVFRSNKQISVQIIDDLKGVTLVSATSLCKEIAVKTGVTKIEQAKLVGKLIAEKAIEKGISMVAFDRNGYLYHGRVKSLAESAREGGLKF